MGFFDLFKKKANPPTVTIAPSALETAQAKNLMRQLQESAEIVNTTTAPKTFWSRLNFSLDVLLELQKYEKYGLFKNSTPTNDYNKILSNLEATVNDFIDRVIISQSDKNDQLNTQKEKDKRTKKCIENLWHSFYESNDYWQGNNMYPHYTGKLYADSNLKRVEDILQDLELKEIKKSVEKENTASSSARNLSPVHCTISLHSSEQFKKYEEECVERFIEEDRKNADRSARFNRDLTLNSAKEHRIDLVAVSNHMGGCCSECAKYSGRVYSISGKSRKYPQLPASVRTNGNFHHGCWCSMNLYFEGSSVYFMGESLSDTEIRNRPYSDNRTSQQIEWYEHRYDDKIAEAKEYAAKEFDRKEYESIQKALPDLAPKSFSAYRRMKNGNTAGFQKILNAVQTVEK